MVDKRIYPEEYLEKAIKEMNNEYGSLMTMGRAHTQDEQIRFERLDRATGLVKKALEILKTGNISNSEDANCSKGSL